MSRLRSVPTPGVPRSSASEVSELMGKDAPCGYLTIAVSGRITAVNDTLLAWTGHARAELVGQLRLLDLLTAGGKIYYETHFAPALQMHGSLHEIALDMVCSDGSRLPVLLNAVLVRDVPTQSAEIRIAVFDATERRAYERELLSAKLRAEQAEERARALARTLQATLIPPTPPVIDGLEVAAVYLPHGAGEEVGGDFYDVFQLDERTWLVALGDVCGTGVEAAVVTALVRHTLRAVTMSSETLSEALTALNEVMLRHESDRFCTVVLVRLRRTGDTWHATICQGGHPLTLHRDAQGEVSFVGEPGSLTGALPEVDFTDVEMLLEPGAKLVLYTDGVTEARQGTELFGDDRLLQTVASLGPSPRLVVDGLVGRVVEFAGGTAEDDIAVVCIGISEPHDH
ncbi:MAG: SpoIIE family protein phosphatase [Marmoricola sp.]